MTRYRTGEILAEDAEALVNAVNCVGVMGCGIALQFKKAFPENFREYANACERREVCLGRLFVFETGQLTNPRYIINFPTKRHWRGKSRVEDIEAGLKALAELIRKRSIRSIAVPPLGCGLGGLDWLEVRPRIEEALGVAAGTRGGVRVRPRIEEALGGGERLGYGRVRTPSCARSGEHGAQSRSPQR